MIKKIGNLPKKAKIAIVSVIVLIVTALSIVGNNIIVKQLRGNVGYNTEHLDEGTHLTEVPEGYEAIRTKEELMAISNNPIDSYDKKYILMNDINLAGENWTPIGSYGVVPYEFTGAFDGNNYTISNLNIKSGTRYIGMFARVGYEAVIKNIKLENVNINITGSFSYDTKIGGIAGEQAKGNIIENVHFSGNITVSNNNNNDSQVFIGGIAGISSGEIKNSSMIGNITATMTYNGKNSGAPDYVGGITGSSGIITNCYTKGSINVSANEKYCINVGGLLGGGGKLENSHSEVDITCNEVYSVGRFSWSRYVFYNK